MEPLDDKIPQHPHLLSPTQLLQTYKPFQFGIKNHYNKQDPRVKNIDLEWVHNKKVLDLGCGEGNLALQLAIRYFPQSILGIDLSSIMIKYANTTLDRIKKQEESKLNKKPSDLPISYKRISNNLASIHPQNLELLGILHELPDSIIYRSENNDKKSKEVQYILKDMDIQFSLGHNKPISTEFPRNISYECLNFFQLEEREDYLFDTIFCMSVVKSIHLTFGEEILKAFFNKIHQHLKPQGILILELQEYKSYKKDSKLSLINKKHFQQMVLRPRLYSQHLEQTGFKLLKTIDSRQHPQLKKSILVFFKS